MKEVLEKMKKRLKWDTFFCIVVMLILVGIGVSLLIANIAELNGVSQTDVEAVTAASEGIVCGARFLFMAIVLGSILGIFIGIQEGITPFTKRNITLLRIAGIMSICAAMIPAEIGFIVRFTVLMESEITFNYLSPSMFLFLFGIILLLLSEVFSYGCSLQEDADLIA